MEVKVKNNLCSANVAGEYEADVPALEAAPALLALEAGLGGIAPADVGCKLVNEPEAHVVAVAGVLRPRVAEADDDEGVGAAAQDRV